MLFTFVYNLFENNCTKSQLQVLYNLLWLRLNFIKIIFNKTLYILNNIVLTYYYKLFSSLRIYKLIYHMYTLKEKNIFLLKFV